jgi:hypothetical protein
LWEAIKSVQAVSKAQYQSQTLLILPESQLNTKQCDKKRDSCGQCLRAQLTCPGYHNPNDLVFRDETKAVLTKVFVHETSTIPTSILETLEARAKNLFYSHHVFGASPMLEYMKVFYPLDPSKDAYCMFTLKAVSLAYLANEFHDSSIRRKASKKYSLALMLTQHTLQDPQMASQSLTLLTILLLGLFENLTSEQDKFDAETKHLEGALTLTKLRGSQQFRSPLGLVMFMHLGSDILSSCLRHGTYVPIEYTRLRAQAQKYIDATEPLWYHWQVSELMWEFAEFQAAKRLMASPDTNGPRIIHVLSKRLEVLSESILADKDLQSWNNGLIQTHARMKSDIHLLRVCLNRELGAFE